MQSKSELQSVCLFDPSRHSSSVTLILVVTADERLARACRLALFSEAHANLGHANPHLHSRVYRHLSVEETASLSPWEFEHAHKELVLSFELLIQ